MTILTLRWYKTTAIPTLRFPYTSITIPQKNVSTSLITYFWWSTGSHTNFPQRLFSSATLTEHPSGVLTGDTTTSGVVSTLSTLVCFGCDLANALVADRFTACSCSIPDLFERRIESDQVTNERLDHHAPVLALPELVHHLCGLSVRWPLDSYVSSKRLLVEWRPHQPWWGPGGACIE